MFGSIGGAELVFVLILALLLFGPRKLPQIGRSLGKGLSELRKASTDFRMNLEREVDLDGVRDARRDLKQAASTLSAGSLLNPPPSDAPREAPDPGAETAEDEAAEGEPPPENGAARAPASPDGPDSGRS